MEPNPAGASVLPIIGNNFINNPTLLYTQTISPLISPTNTTAPLLPVLDLNKVDIVNQIIDSFEDHILTPIFSGMNDVLVFAREILADPKQYFHDKIVDSIVKILPVTLNKIIMGDFLGLF